MKKDAYYFSHDGNARNDLKCVKLRRSLGWEGYGLFWAIIEILRETDNYSLDFSSIDDLAFELKVDLEKVKSVINDFGLFRTKGTRFYSQRLSESMSKYNETKKQLSESGKRGNAIRWRSGGDGQVIALKEIKSKVNKRGKSPDGDGLDHNGNNAKPLDGMVF